jgi:hypothetical protein
MSAILVKRTAPFLRSNIPQTATATLDTYDFLTFQKNVEKLKKLTLYEVLFGSGLIPSHLLQTNRLWKILNQ